MPPTDSIEPLEALRTYFKHNKFKLGQQKIIESVLLKNDAMAVMPTGGGKSLCYQLPAVCMGGLVIVVSPLIALMKDQVGNLEALQIHAGAIYSGQSAEEKIKIFSDIEKHGNYILFVSPERVQKPGFAKWIQKQNVTLFAIDEAHCVSQWGPDFREDYHRLKILRELCPNVPILALTATATKPVLQDVSVQLGLRKPDLHVYGFYRPGLFYQVQSCAHEEDKQAYVKQALNQNTTGRVIIYCGTRKQTEELTAFLKSQFAGVDFYHAGLSHDARGRVQESFRKGEIRILAATNAFGMGIDHPDVRLVVHFQMPANIESLYQEMGRGGRDGLDATCLLLYSKKDKGLQSYFINTSDAAADVIDRRWRALEAICQYAEGGECRHSGILTYFKDTQRIKECGHCDICKPDSSRNISAPPRETITRKSSAKKVSGRASAKTSGKGDSSSPLTNDQEVRFQVLKEWRKAYADEKDIPAFIVFSNKTLRDLAIKKPTNSDDLEKIYGMGPHKIEHLGNLILAKISEAN